MTLPEFAKALRILAIVIYTASLLLAPYKTRDPVMEAIGIFILSFGWVSLYGLMTAWLANPLVIFCFFQMKNKPALCSVLSVLALLAAHDFNKVHSLGFDSGRDIYAGEVIGIGLGCYVWLSSLAITFFASLVFLLNSRRVHAQN